MWMITNYNGINIWQKGYEFQNYRSQESFIRGNLQYMQLTIGCIQFLLYILIWVVGKTICLEQTHIN